MSAIAPISDKVAKLIRLLASDRDGEVVGAVHALRRTLKAAGTDLHALADAVGGKTRFSEEDVEIAYRSGYGDGKRDAQVNDGFRNIGAPTWHEMALFCLERIGRLEEKHHGFVSDMASRTVSREPTEKQGKYLQSLYFKLGGKP